jgi:hypothetical protein
LTTRIAAVCRSATGLEIEAWERLDWTGRRGRSGLIEFGSEGKIPTSRANKTAREMGPPAREEIGALKQRNEKWKHHD